MSSNEPIQYFSVSGLTSTGAYHDDEHPKKTIILNAEVSKFDDTDVFLTVTLDENITEVRKFERRILFDGLQFICWHDAYANH